MPVTPSVFDSQDNVIIQWVGETGNGVGVQANQWPDKTIQATGTGTVTLEGSPDNINWVALKDSAGVAISLAAASFAISIVGPNPVFIRPVNAVGTATITITGNGNG